MLIQNADNTFTAGPFDILCIMKLPTGTYHVAFLEEQPFPGPVPTVAETGLVRLKSKMHHTTGAETLEGAQTHLRDMRTRIELPDDNVVVDAAIEVTDPMSVWTISSWKGNGSPKLKDQIAHRLRLEVVVH